VEKSEKKYKFFRKTPFFTAKNWLFFEKRDILCYEEIVKRMFQAASIIFLRSDYMKIVCLEVKSSIYPPPPNFGSCRCFGAVLLCVFLLSGCRMLKGSGNGEDDTQSADPVWEGVPVVGQEGNPSIKAKFGVILEGKDGVDAAFHELKAFISKGRLESMPDVISTGDWIDLEADLTVLAYNGSGGFEAVNSKVTPSPLPFPEYEGSTLRLIVVGINSFREEKGVDEQYTVTENNGVDHVVFQFQNLPVERRMNPGPSDTNAGGYAKSEMRKYLVPVDGAEGSGNFLAGLITAGVPEDVLWAPARYVANGGSEDATGFDKINDILWLPTEWEMLGDRVFSSEDYETVENQARLEYYNSKDRCKKYLKTDPGVHFYWDASPKSSDSASFCDVDSSGGGNSYNASYNAGVAPAFCVR
jgi:hypothetical protein